MKQSNRIKVSGAVIALGICASAALYQPTAARSEGGNGPDNRPQPNAAEHKFGGATGQKFDGQNIGGGQSGGHNGGNHQPPMRPEEMMAQLSLTPQQQTRVQAIYEQEREQMRAIHEKTRAGIMALLTAEQKAKFAQMPQPGPPGQRAQNGGQHDGDRPMMHDGMQGEDHGRPVELIAKDLGVTPEQFREAFKKVRPAGKGERPTEEQLHTNHKVLAEALGVSIEKLDAVMDKYRPEGPDNRPRPPQD